MFPARSCFSDNPITISSQEMPCASPFSGTIVFPEHLTVPSGQAMICNSLFSVHSGTQIVLSCTPIVLSGTRIVLPGAQTVLSGAQFVLSGAPIILSGAPFVLPGAQILLSGTRLVLSASRILLSGIHIVLSGSTIYPNPYIQDVQYTQIVLSTGSICDNRTF